MYAGGLNDTNNKSYYLYNGQSYWTMSPKEWLSNDTRAIMFCVHEYGYHSSPFLGNANDLRPVINLVPDTQFKAGTDGTLNNPYEVI